MDKPVPKLARIHWLLVTPTWRSECLAYRPSFTAAVLMLVLGCVPVLGPLFLFSVPVFILGSEHGERSRAKASIENPGKASC